MAKIKKADKRIRCFKRFENSKNKMDPEIRQSAGIYTEQMLCCYRKNRLYYKNNRKTYFFENNNRMCGFLSNLSPNCTLE